MSPASPPSPRPPRADHLYQGASGLAYHEVKRALPPAALEWVLRLRARKFQPWIAASDVVLEFGVGAGWNLARLGCARRLGCDPADHLADRVRALGIEFLHDTQSLAGATIDTLIAHHVLEHLVDPAAALSEMARLLKPQGRLVLHVPWETERRYATYRPDDPNHHLYHWNAQNLGNLVAVLGWRIESVTIRRYGYDRAAATVAARTRLGETGFRLLRAFLIAVRPLREVELIARR